MMPHKNKSSTIHYHFNRTSTIQRSIKTQNELISHLHVNIHFPTSYSVITFILSLHLYLPCLILS